MKVFYSFINFLNWDDSELPGPRCSTICVLTFSSKNWYVSTVLTNFVMFRFCRPNFGMFWLIYSTQFRYFWLSRPTFNIFRLSRPSEPKFYLFKPRIDVLRHSRPKLAIFRLSLLSRPTTRFFVAAESLSVSGRNHPRGNLSRGRHVNAPK